MEDKSVPGSAPPSTSSTPDASTPTPGSSASKPKHEKAWRPRVDSERVLHGFTNETLEADSILESPEVRDPDEDTAPLQGSKDRSDEDSMEDID
jgi:hypothetical protein